MKHYCTTPPPGLVEKAFPYCLGITPASYLPSLLLDKLLNKRNKFYLPPSEV